MKELDIGTTNYRISDQLRDICRCHWNVATYKWKVHNGKIEIMSFVVHCNVSSFTDSHYQYLDVG
jgi:hypothetical protein